MCHYWLIITFSCFGSASLQYLNAGSDITLNQLDYMQLDPVSRHLATPFTTHFQHQTAPGNPLGYYPQKIYPEKQLSQELEPPPPEKDRYRRTVGIDGNYWIPNLVDTDKTFYYQGDMKPIPDAPVEQSTNQIDETTTEKHDLRDLPITKRNFSPWGGKRSAADADTLQDHMWSWKRGLISKEPMMPKRVRFSPWGGKRSGQVILRPNGKKGLKLIYSTNMPELTRVITNYYPGEEKYNFAGFQFIPSVDKRHPVKILAVSSNLNKPDSIGFTQFAAFLPKLFKLGHPYVEYNMKKDGKRKVKFSAWGGKRSPPIIGPIWTRGPINFPESLLDAILVVKTPATPVEGPDVDSNVV